MVLFGTRHRAGEQAARAVLLLQERGLGGRGEDLEARLSRWNGERGGRAEASRKLAGRWASSAQDLLPAGSGRTGETPPLAIILAAGRPGFVAKRRGTSGEE